MRIEELQLKYENLDNRMDARESGAVDAECLLAFEYEYPEQPSEITIESDEFTAVCPWTGLPDLGTVTVEYIPYTLCLELKSLKYYLLSFRDVGIVQEHAASRILRDMVDACSPRQMKVTLDYRVRGGIHTSVTVKYPVSEDR